MAPMKALIQSKKIYTKLYSENYLKGYKLLAIYRLFIYNKGVCTLLGFYASSYALMEVR